mmetsp:Transcript_91048/g.190443  ORF Transcript_91048/g.190443 Transcript_91048/m.190443 type:complete len:475 (-) Transcript_91048:78-1502(-)
MEEPLQSLRARWPILLLTCGGLFGQFFAFDIPSALNEQFRQTLTVSSGVDDKEYAYLFNLLYSVYSIPNIFLPLVLGMAVDRCGFHVLIVLLGLAVFVGQLLFTLGVAEASWPIMLGGRVLFGLGAESMQVAQGCLLFRWFKGNEVAFALGLNLSVARAGSVLNDLVSPWFVQRHGIMGAAALGSALCFASLLCNVCSVAVDRIEGKKANLPAAAVDEGCSPRDLLKMPSLYWLLVVMCVSVYCGILPFNNIASAFFVETRYSQLPLIEAQKAAGSAMSLLFLSSAIGTPPFGLVIDNLGFRRHFLLASSVLLSATYSVIFGVSPATSMLMLGMVYMVFAGALWPSLALTVPQRLLGTAYGVATSCQNAGLALVPMFIGHLQATSANGDFKGVIQLLACFGLLGILSCLLILLAGLPGGELLDLPSKEAERRLKLGEHTPLKVGSTLSHSTFAQDVAVTGKGLQNDGKAREMEG